MSLKGKGGLAAEAPVSASGIDADERDSCCARDRRIRQRDGSAYCEVCRSFADEHGVAAFDGGLESVIRPVRRERKGQPALHCFEGAGIESGENYAANSELFVGLEDW